MNALTFRLYTSVGELPDRWDELAASNIFLSRAYLRVLEFSAPKNMRCHFVGLYDQTQLVGVALSQFIDLRSVQSFGDRDHCLKTRIREIVFKNFSSSVLFMGNNMLTGQNALVLADGILWEQALPALQLACEAIRGALKQSRCASDLIVWKDFSQTQIRHFDTGFQNYFKFTTQPNMVLEIPQAWKSFDDYVGALLKKYRDQFKRARKKFEGLDKRKMPLEEIERYQQDVYRLYRTVADNAPFNTFYLPDDHFAEFKRQLGDRFLFYGYFDGEKIVGFNTLIRNGDDIDTYFLGYDAHYQRERMLYLNMLYDMTAYTINQGYKKIVFARTALEIKSSVGAVPVEMFGLIRHSNGLANRYMPKLFRFFEPPSSWQQRHPFKP